MVWRHIRQWFVYAVATDSPHLLTYYIQRAKAVHNLTPDDIISHGISTYDVHVPMGIAMQYEIEKMQFSLWDIACIHGSERVIPQLKQWFPISRLADTSKQNKRTVWMLDTQQYKMLSFSEILWWMNANSNPSIQQDKVAAIVTSIVVNEHHKNGTLPTDAITSFIMSSRCGSFLDALEVEMLNWKQIIPFPKFVLARDPDTIANYLCCAERYGRSEVIHVLLAVARWRPDNLETTAHALVRNNINPSDFKGNMQSQTVIELQRLVDMIKLANQKLCPAEAPTEMSLF